MFRQEWKEFKKFAKEQAERNDDLDDWCVEAKKDEEEILTALEDGNKSYLVQSEFFLAKLYDCRAYKLLFENIISKDEKLPEDTLKEIREVIEQTGGESEFTMTTEEIKEMRKERKEELKKKKQMKFTPLDEDDWRG